MNCNHEPAEARVSPQDLKPSPRISSRSTRSRLWILALGALVATGSAVFAQGVLDVEIRAGHNLVIDSNVTSPSTYAPGAAYIGASVCNTGNAALNNVIVRIGDFGGGTAGVFPASTFSSPAYPHLDGTGSYALTLESGATGVADGTRYVGTLQPGECRMQYWLISYPQCVNQGGDPDSPPCVASIAGANTTADDPSLNYDVWATADAAATASVTRDFTLRSEISAAANKIWPNTTAKVPDEYLTALQSLVGWGTLGPDGQPFDGSNPVFPGQRVITTQGIWYDLGNVSGGFDNDGDLISDQNAWLQPIGDPSIFDAGCFRLVNVYGIVIVKLKSGGEMLIPFQNELYFTGIPDNTGVVGLVYYQYIATGEGCNAQLSPYQEAASGSNNEKFSADYGLTLSMVSGTFGGGDLAFEKTDNIVPEPGTGVTAAGNTLTYTFSATNTSGVNLGAPDIGAPLSFRDSIPDGTIYVAGSADDSPATNLLQPTGTGSFIQGYTDIDGNLDLCDIDYNITSSSWVVLYSTDDGATWTTTEPVPASTVTDLQWLLFTTIALDGGHDGTGCVARDGVFDDGTESTSLPPDKSVSVSFQATVSPSVGPVVCNAAIFGFGGNTSSTLAEECTLVSGINAISGTVFRDNAATGGIFGNGVQDGTESGIGAGVEVALYYDLNGDGKLDAGDLEYGATTTNATGDYSFSGLPDGPYLVVVNKYDDGTGSNSATDSTYGTTGWGSTTADPNLPLATDTGLVRASESVTEVVLAVNVDLDRNNGVAVSLAATDFGFAPPLLVTKNVLNNPDADDNGVADTDVDEGSLVTYTLALQNRLPSVGVQGPTGCQYIVWATAGGTGSNPRDFTNPTNAYDASSPNGSIATALVSGGSLRWIFGTSFSLAPQLGNITKVEGLYFGYFDTVLTDDFLNLSAGLAGSGLGTGGITGALSTVTIPTALIDNYVGAPAGFDPNSAISWDLTATRPGGGGWAWTDFSGMFLQVNPSKTANADAKTFSIDAIGLRVTSDQNCEAGASTTLSPVPLRDTWDTGSFTFVSANPVPTSVDTVTGVILWDDVGPILPGTTTTVTVTLRANDVSGTRIGTCASLPPTANSACNYAEAGFGTSFVYYADGRQANTSSDSMAVNIVGRGELRGTVWSDTDNDGWPIEAEPGLSGVVMTLWGCVRANGVTLETGTSNTKPCATATNGNFWKALSTTVTSSLGAYEFLGLRSGYYLIEVGDNDDSPTGGNVSPYAKTQTAEPDDDQSSTGGNADGRDCPTCNNIWGDPSADLRGDQTTINFLDGAAEETLNGINFGYYSDTAVVFGNIWYDVDNDASQDPGESGQAGFTVRIYADADANGVPDSSTPIATTTTDSSGNYTFTGLAAGSYVVDVVPPTLPNAVWTETLESTGGTGSLNNQIPVTVAAGDVSGSHSFGYAQASTSNIGDSLFIDLDGDGIKDATEAGIPNVTVWLYEDVDRDGTIDDGVDALVATTVTDASGNYLFEDFAAGSYIVRIDTSDPDFPTNVTPTGDPDLNTGRIGDFLFFDSNGDGLATGESGIPGVTVELYRDSLLVASTVTDINGNYLFTGLGAGTYIVDVDESTLPSSAFVLTTADPSLTAIVLATSSSVDLSADAGYSPSGADFAMGNRVWHDVDGDGVQDAGEVGMPGIDITVTGPNCTPCTATTDESGFWIVTGLTATGNYSVDVDNADLPRDFTLTSGTDPRNVTMASADNMNVDFGFRYTGSGSSPTSSVTGRVFLDADGDLAYDAGEERDNATWGTRVNLIDANGYVIATTTTDASGNYSFSGAFVGSYTVEAIDPLGARYSAVFLSAGSPFTGLNVIFTSTTETVADGQASVSVDGVHDYLLIDFGYRRLLGSIGDLVYYDVNENGAYDLGETGLSGIDVSLFTATWNDANNDGFVVDSEISVGPLVATTATLADDPATTTFDETGTYLFANLEALPANTYYLIRIDTTDLPVGSTQTGDPDADGTPCADLPTPGNPAPAGVCDNQQLAISFTDGNNYFGADFGYGITSFASVGDHLWIDTDNDGVLDPGEPGIPYITVWLDTNGNSALDWTDGNGNGVWDSGEGERWVETDTDGYFVFPNLANGTYDVRVLTTDTNWPAGLATTPTYEAGTASFDNHVEATVNAGDVTAIDGVSCGAPGTCDVGLDIDFGYRYSGVNSVSGTICTDDASFNGTCGDGTPGHTGTTAGESPLSGILVGFYQWFDDGDNAAWNGTTGVLDAGDAFTFLGSTTTDSSGDYTFDGLPDNVVVVFSVAAAQNIRLTTTNGNTTAADVVSRQLFDGTGTYNGNTVTEFARQAMQIGGDIDDVIEFVDFAFDLTLGGAVTYDFGDLPSAYANTLLAQGGAQSLVTSTPDSIRLGFGIDTETDGTQATLADADGADDGIFNVPASVNRNVTTTFTAQASAAGWLGGWIDWNGDGDFDDAGEAFVDQAVVAGNNTISFTPPATLTPGANVFFTRFRIYPSRPALFASTGVALDAFFQPAEGEVEDYQWNINVTPAIVTSFVARPQGSEMVLEWTTAGEIGTVGFYLRRYEPETREWVAVNDEMLVALLGSPQGGRYRFVDRDARFGVPYHYQLVEVESSGAVNGYGPYAAGLEPENLGVPDIDVVPLVEDSYHREFSKAAHPLRRDEDRPFQFDRFAKAADPKKPRAIGAKIAVATTGIQYVKASDIEAAGFAVDKTWLTSSKNLYEFSNRGEIHSFMAAPDASGVYFYGEALESIFSSDNVYWIGESKRNSPRMKVRKQGAVSPSDGSETFRRKIRFEEDKFARIYGEFYTDPESSFWAWDFLIAGQGAKTFGFRADGAAQTMDDVYITVHLLGATDTPADPDHHAVIRLNGQKIGDARWNGLEHSEVRLRVSSSLLVDGANVLEVESVRDTGAPQSVSYVDWFEVEFDSHYRARENRLDFVADGNSTILVSGFTRADVMVFDVTDPRDPVFVEVPSTSVGGGYGVTITPQTATSRYIALTADAVTPATRIKPDTPSTLASSANVAEYLVITTNALRGTAQRLADHRADLSSQVIDIEDIWDEFNYGIARPHALRAFLDHANRNWSVAPKYVVLAGGGTFDYKDHYGIGDNLLPPMHVYTPFGLFPSDNWLANTDTSSAVPEVALGRIPATTAAELSSAIDKIIARERRVGEAWQRSLLMMADNADSAGNFPADSDRIATLLPSGTALQKVYLSMMPVTAARSLSITAMNQGTGIVSYVGHGGFDTFAAEGMLRIADLSLLTNADRPTVVTGMTCNVGYFSLPGYASLGEHLLLGANGGAAAIWVATGMSQNEQAVALAKAFYRIVSEGKSVRIGDAIQSALKAYSEEGRPAYMIDIYTLFGDPAMKLY